MFNTTEAATSDCRIVRFLFCGDSSFNHALQLSSSLLDVRPVFSFFFCDRPRQFRHFRRAKQVCCKLGNTRRRQGRGKCEIRGHSLSTYVFCLPAFETKRS